MYDVRCTMYDVRLMYDWVYVRCTRPFVLLLLCTSFVHRTFVLRTSRLHLSFVHQRILVLPVVRRHFQAPQIAPERLLTAGGVLLSAVRGLVGCHLLGVLLTGCYGSCDSCKTLALLDLRGLDRRGTLVSVGVVDVQTLAVGVGGFCGTVGRDEVVTVVVTVLTYGFLQCAGDSFDTGGSYYSFCHSCSAISRSSPRSQRSKPLR